MKFVTTGTDGKLIITKRQAVELVQILIAIIAKEKDLIPGRWEPKTRKASWESVFGHQIILSVDHNEEAHALTLKEAPSGLKWGKFYFVFRPSAAHELVAALVRSNTFKTYEGVNAHGDIVWAQYALREAGEPLYLHVVVEK